MKVCVACHYIFWQYEFFCPVCSEKENAAWERAAPDRMQRHEKEKIRKAKREPSGSRTKREAIQAAYREIDQARRKSTSG